MLHYLFMLLPFNAICHVYMCVCAYTTALVFCVRVYVHAHRLSVCIQSLIPCISVYMTEVCVCVCAPVSVKQIQCSVILASLFQRQTQSYFRNNPRSLFSVSD